MMPTNTGRNAHDDTDGKGRDHYRGARVTVAEILPERTEGTETWIRAAGGPTAHAPYVPDLRRLAAVA